MCMSVLFSGFITYTLEKTSLPKFGVYENWSATDLKPLSVLLSHPQMLVFRISHPHRTCTGLLGARDLTQIGMHIFQKNLATKPLVLNLWVMTLGSNNL